MLVYDKKGSTKLILLMQEGPVHDVQWSASGDHFVTVSGFMPAKANVFNSKCKMLHELCTGPYNLVRWNPQVRASSHSRKEGYTCSEVHL